MSQVEVTAYPNLSGDVVFAQSSIGSDEDHPVFYQGDHHSPGFLSVRLVQLRSIYAGDFNAAASLVPQTCQGIPVFDADYHTLA
jgi:hypothetical protein